MNKPINKEAYILDDSIVFELMDLLKAKARHSIQLNEHIYRLFDGNFTTLESNVPVERVKKMATIDEQLNVRTETGQAVAKECNFTEFNPLFEDLSFSLIFFEERDSLKLEKYDIYQALMIAYSFRFNRGKKAHKLTKWLEK